MSSNQSATPAPQGNYSPATREGNLIFTAGMTPRRAGVLIRTGGISSSDPVDVLRESAELAVQNALTAACSVLTESEQLRKVVSMTVYVASTDPEFDKHPKVADFASDYLAAQLGAAGISARAAVGVFTLPSKSPLEISLVVAV